MGKFRGAEVVLWAFVLAYILLRSTPKMVQALPLPLPTLIREAGMTPFEACEDFASSNAPGSAWTLDDCLKTWEDFLPTISPGYLPRFPHVDMWRDTADKVRRAGSPCLLGAIPVGDGVGSSTTRHLASWIFAEQMGCDWETPVWKKSRFAVDGNGTAGLYCHWTAPMEGVDPWTAPKVCEVANWLTYFQFNVPSVPTPSGTPKVIELKISSQPSEDLLALQQSIITEGISLQPWDRVAIRFHPTSGTQYLVNAGSWDATKRQIVRNVLQQARKNFHRHLRPWSDENQRCLFSEESLNFAVHVRMGDRKKYLDGNDTYFDLLEVIMDQISSDVVSKGLEEPLFHVFSETQARCPSGETGLFDEFPKWPVGVDQIPECLAAAIPDDCPEKRGGSRSCRPTHHGIFKVVDKNIMLHVAPEVQSCLSCMIQADGVLMGCSTFGQLAGLLTKGISMFSTQCLGEVTPVQYRTIPPIAIADMGQLWVPIAGSWRDPVLTSTRLFRGALDTLLAQRELVG